MGDSNIIGNLAYNYILTIIVSIYHYGGGQVQGKRPPEWSPLLYRGPQPMEEDS